MFLFSLSNREYDFEKSLYRYKNRKLFKDYSTKACVGKIIRKSSRKLCKCCGKKKYDISQHGFCVKCATEKVELARLQIKHKSGPIYEKWKEKISQGLNE